MPSVGAVVKIPDGIVKELDTLRYMFPDAENDSDANV